MNFTDAIIQGIVQGLTEFLPVSSSGHLSLVQYFTGQSGDAAGAFSIFLHFGTLVAVFIAFFPTIWQLVLEVFSILRDLFTGRFSLKTDRPYRRMIYLLFVSLLPLLLVLPIKGFYDSVSRDQDIIIEGICFMITGALLYCSDKVVKGRRTVMQMNYRNAFTIGVAQAIAPLPGISRSGSTIATGLILGLDRKLAVDFSFIMGIPAVLGANLLELGDVAKNGLDIPLDVLLVGVLVSALVGLAAIKMVRWIVKKDKFMPFAIYTFCLGVLVVIAGIVELSCGAPLRHMLMA